MLSVSSGMSAGQAGSYFSKEDYYLKGGEASEWLGKGSEELGLSGKVAEADFKALCAGNDPRTGEQIVAGKISYDKQTGEQKEERRAGNDLTFSAPKSVSVAYAAGVGGIKEAHDEAVKAVMSHVSQHYSHARTPEGLKQADMAAAKFDHVTSRAGEPQLHSHCFLINAAKDEHGQWRSNDPKNIFTDQKALGKLYRSELINQLEKQGHQVEVKSRETLDFSLKGVDEKLVEQFSSRREAIEAQVKEWKEEGKYKGVDHARLYEMAALETRDAKQQVEKADVEKAWDKGFAESGTSRPELKAELETAAARTLADREQEATKAAGESQPQTEKETAAEIVGKAASYLTENEAVIDRAKLLDTAAQISGGQHSVSDLNAAIDGKAEGIERLGADARGREHYTTADMRQLEARNLETVKALSDTFKPVTDKAEVEKYLDKLSKNEGIKLTDGQKALVTNELAGKHGVSVAQGDPGTGKTFASKIVERYNSEVLQPSGREHCTINIAYTGKAALEMSEASGKPAYTIDSFLNAYAAGKVRVAEPERAHQRDAATMARAERTNTTAEGHSAEMAEKAGSLRSPATEKETPTPWTTAAERRGMEGVREGFGAKLGDRSQGETSIRIGRRGAEVAFAKSAETLPGGVTTSTTRHLAGGGKSEESRTQIGNSHYGSGRVSRTDGSKASWKENGVSFGGIYSRSSREERTGDAVKITKSSTWGRVTKGKTTTINRDGKISETTWEGKRGFFSGKFEVTNSTTRSYTDQALADKHHSSLTDKMVSGICAGVYKLINKEDNARPLPSVAHASLSPEGKSPATGQIPQPTGRKGEISIPKGAQVVLKVDESSFVGARQAEHLLSVVKELQSQGVQAKLELVGDQKQMQAIQAGNMFAQAQSLAKEGKADFAHLSEINRQKDADLLRVAQTLNKDGNHGMNAREALRDLREQGRVTEIGDRGELIKATVSKYLEESAKPSRDPEKAANGEKQSVILATTLNSDRTVLNKEIREARISAGEIEKGQSYEVLTPARQGVTADAYKEGQHVVFSGYRGEDGKQHAWGARLQTEGEVTGIDREHNAVQVRYSFTGKDGNERVVTKSLDAAEMATKTTVYNREEREFAPGDRIVALKNDKELGLQNGSMATIAGLDKDGNARLALDGGKEVNINLNEYQNIDHGYAVTVHKSQGATVESALQFAYVKPGQEQGKEQERNATTGEEAFGHASYNALNVATTRATHEAHVMTNSLSGLEKAVEKVDEKSTTLDDKWQQQPEQPEAGKPGKEEVNPSSPSEISQSEPGQPQPTGIEPTGNAADPEKDKDQSQESKELDDLKEKIDSLQRQDLSDEARQELVQMEAELDQIGGTGVGLQHPEAAQELDHLSDKIDQLEAEVEQEPDELAAKLDELEQGEELTASEAVDRAQELAADGYEPGEIAAEVGDAGAEVADIAEQQQEEVEMDMGD